MKRRARVTQSRSPEGLFNVTRCQPFENATLREMLEYASDESIPLPTLAGDLAIIEKQAHEVLADCSSPKPGTAEAMAVSVLAGVENVRGYVDKGYADLAAHAALGTMGSYLVMQTLRMERPLRIGINKQELPRKLGKDRQKATPEAIERWQSVSNTLWIENPAWKRNKSRAAQKIATLSK